MNDFCDLARQSLSHWLTHGKKLPATPRTGYHAGCFVSLHTAANELRGCIGTIEPAREDLAEEIVENAISAGTRDPRFPAVKLKDLASLRVEVSVLHPPEPVSDLSQLDPVKYGVVVEKDGRRGVLLPDLEGVATIQQQLAIAKRKASIPAGATVRIQRFEVEKHHESS